jgi:hypothetical protein
MARIGRPELYPVKKIIGFDKGMLAAVDDWRRTQTPVPNVSDAIRALVTLGLQRSAPGTRTAPRKSKAKRK